jgi:hypothetical protein
VTDIGAAIASAGAQQPIYAVVEQGTPASPYAFDRYYAMDNFRAEKLGFRFTDSADWLGRVAAEALAAGRGA